MRGYEEYEDLDEYEDEEEEVEYEVEEAPQPTKEEREYLELRQRLKESIRKQMKKESGLASSNSREKNKAASYDNYGSFFGPSQPVIAQRVIQESKSLLENHHLIGNAPKSQIQKNKPVSSNGRPRPPQGSIRPPKVVNQQKLKVETLKQTRDYSFLLSDDVELPVPSREPPSRAHSAPNSEARSANTLPKSRQPSQNNVSRQVPNDDYKSRTHSSMSSRVDPKMGSQRPISSVKNNQMPTTVRKQPVSSSSSGNRNGQGRPMAPKGGSLSSKTPPPQASVERKMSFSKEKSSVPLMTRKTPPTKLHSSASRQIPAPKPIINGDHRKEQMEMGGRKGPVRPTNLSAKPQVRPPARLPPRDDHIKKNPVVKQRPAKRAFEEDDAYEAQNISGMIRNMFGYNPNKYANNDDDSDMEANYEDIMREERRSAKIARKEDEEELQKIEEEERRERIRRLKKRKVS